ncbi:MAG: MBG domain-containing protein [Bacilli bacterium]|nr:MBG domain-containing protein [Bacilli bacterium]
MNNKSVKIFLLGMLAGSLFSATNTQVKKNVVAEDDPVDTIEELQALVDEGSEVINLDHDIVVTDNSTWPLGIGAGKNVTINANGHLITAEEPGTTAYGDVNPDASDLYLFDIEGSLTINDAIIRGGKQGAIKGHSDSNFALINSTVERSGGPGMDKGGGIYTDPGVNNKVFLKNSKISRNIALAGGGFYTKSKFFIAENCSFNENRSCAGNGGGGAGECGGTIAIFNNCTIANNLSTEIGGAVNCNGNTVTFINSNVIGNTTTDFPQEGGGIGVNGADINIFNTNIVNNFHINGTTITVSDIGFYDGNLDNNIEIYGSAYNGIINNEALGADDMYYPLVSGNKKADLNEGFYSYTKSSSLVYSDDYQCFIPTALIKRPILILNDKNTYESFLSEDSSLLNGGCDTYFSYPSDIAEWTTENILLSYKKDGVMQDVRSYWDDSQYYFSKPLEADKVSLYQDGRERCAGVIGASGVTDGEYCTLTILPDNNINVVGGSCFGDAYKKGTQLSVIATEKDADNFPFAYWYDATNDIKHNDIDHYKNITLNENLTIQPISKGSYYVSNGWGAEDKEFFGGYIDSVEGEALSGDIINVTSHAEPGYELAYLQLENADNGSYTNVVGNSFEMPNHDVFVNPFYWEGRNPVGKSLTYTGEEQELVVGGYSGYAPLMGYVDDGEFYYSLTGNADDYSLDLPKATNAGEYIIYWNYYHDQFSESFWTPVTYDRSGFVKTTITGVDYDQVDIDAIEFNDLTIQYDGERHSLVAANLPGGVTATYSYNQSAFKGAREIGEYKITASFVSGPGYNQIPSKQATLKIVKGTFSNIVFEGDELTYDGESHMIEVSNLPQNVGVTYYVNGQEFNGATDAGEYVVTATFDVDLDHYNAIADMTATLKINKATYAAPTFDGAEFTYDGESHMIEVSNLPQNVDVTYYVNDEVFTGAVDAGEYVVTAKFTGDVTNYNQIQDLTATLTIIDPTQVIDLLWLVILLGCLDLALVGLLVYLVVSIRKAKKDTKEIAKMSAVAPVIVFIKWQIVTIILLAVIFAALVVLDIIYFKKYKDLEDK